MSQLNNLPIKLRLSILVGLMLAVALFIGLLGLNGMRNAGHAIEKLFHNDMAHMHELASINEKVENSRTQVLLSLQHDSTSPFAAMHDHPLSQHIDVIQTNFNEISDHWKEYSASPLPSEEKSLASDLEKELTKFEKEDIKRVVEKLLASDFLAANEILLKTINPRIKQLHSTIEELITVQERNAELAFEATNASYHTIITWVIISMIAGALVSLLFAYIIISGITHGVEQVEMTAIQLADGNLNARVDYRNKDELGRIANAFNRMANKFHGVINEIKDSVSQLAAAAEETSTVTTQTRGGINQQLTETSQVATAINEMSATVQEVARNAVEAATAAREADIKFDEGKKVIDRVINSIGELASEVDKAANVIQQLEKESLNIGSVLDVIKSIAEQTNLLALNAAIEAARAGEQGRGFAVVADEVRTLAGRTQASTAEIEEMIGKLQLGTNNAVKVMTAGKEISQVGVEQAASAGEALQTINAAVERITNMNTQIASAAEEQSTVTDEINHSIVSINSVAEQSAVGAQQTAEASDSLAKLAEQLKGMINQFKV
jgi:methyl-accepting chemotaxis protein